MITNNVNGIQREIKVTGQGLATVTSFKYLVAVVSDDGSKPEVLSRIAQSTAALTKLNKAENHMTWFAVILYLISDRTGKKNVHHLLNSQ